VNTRTLAVAISFALLCAVSVSAQVKLSPSDKKFMTLAADINMTEAHLGEMAQQHASQGGVKDFGQTLATDHETAYGRLLGVAERVHEQIPRGIDVRNDRDVQQLSRLKGMTFDHRFLQDEIRDHKKTLIEFKREADHGENVDIKNYAKDQIKTIEQHLHRAEDLAKEVKQHT